MNLMGNRVLVRHGHKGNNITTDIVGMGYIFGNYLLSFDAHLLFTTATAADT
jgi:hypothetical protein